MGFKDWIATITGRRPQPPPPPVQPSPAAPTESDIMRALDRVEAMVGGGVVPAPVQSRVAPGCPDRTRDHAPAA